MEHRFRGTTTDEGLPVAEHESWTLVGLLVLAHRKHPHKSLSFRGWQRTESLVLLREPSKAINHGASGARYQKREANQKGKLAVLMISIVITVFKRRSKMWRESRRCSTAPGTQKVHLILRTAFSSHLVFRTPWRVTSIEVHEDPLG